MNPLDQFDPMGGLPQGMPQMPPQSPFQGIPPLPAMGCPSYPRCQQATRWRPRARPSARRAPCPVAACLGWPTSRATCGP